MFPLKEPRNMGPQCLQAQNWWGCPLFLPACCPEPDSGTKVCSTLLLPSHPSLPVRPSQSFILRASLPVLTAPLHLWNGQPALPPTLCLESPTQKHPFCHHCRTSLPGTPDTPKECLLVLTSDASKPSGQTCKYPHPSHLTWSKKAYHLDFRGKKHLMSYLS